MRDKTIAWLLIAIIFIIGGCLGFIAGWSYRIYVEGKAWEELRITNTECEYSSQLEYEEAMMYSYEGYASAIS